MSNRYSDMNNKNHRKLLFVTNPSSGNSRIDWPAEIRTYFASLDYAIEFFQLPKNTTQQMLEEKISFFKPDLVVAVGGDGTVNLVARCLIKKNISMGILPAGSANGMARELNINDEPRKAIEILTKGNTMKIHVTMVNDQLCIHLSDVGLNAHAIKKFEAQNSRGMWGYVLASLKVLWKTPMLKVNMQIDQQQVNIKAALIVIANATKYGNGAVINPVGKLDDQVFEIIAIKKISLYEIFKMTFSHAAHDPEKTEIFQATALSMHSARKVHFQVDGEYMGKVNSIKANIIPDAIEIIVP